MKTMNLKRLLIKPRSQYPSEDNVTIITLFLCLANGRYRYICNEATYDKV